MLEVIESNERLQLRMPATLENVEEADDRVAAYLTARKTPVDLFAVRILLREALCNAVIHGSAKNSQKTVHLEVQENQHDVTLRVQDPGVGFQWHDRKAHVDVCGDGGRGLPLMEIYADEMVFNDKGNQITLHKKLKQPATCEGSTLNGREATP